MSSSFHPTSARSWLQTPIHYERVARRRRKIPPSAVEVALFAVALAMIAYSLL